MRMLQVMKCMLVTVAVLVPCIAPGQETRLEERRPAVTQPGSNAPQRHDMSTPQTLGVPGRDVKVEHDPAFIPPFVGSYETSTGTGQYGLSGWTSPNAPMGPAFREINGWFSLGFTLTWDGKPGATSATR